jgi:hypothetical protein
VTKVPRVTKVPNFTPIPLAFTPKFPQGGL